VSQVSVEEWELIDREIETVPVQHRPYLAASAEHLAYARQAFDRFAKCYQAAAGRGFGVSVEFY
jgi:hypothetical protein